MKKTKLLALTLAIAALGGGAAIGLRARSTAGGAPAPGAGTPEGAASAVPHAPSGRTSAPGLRHTYATTFEQDLALAGGSGRADLRVRVTGDLDLAFVAYDDGRHRLYAELTHVSFEAGAPSPASAAVAKELERPFYVATETDGRVRGYAFARDVSPIAQNVLRALLGSAQVALRDGAAWTADEDDVMGSYVASYERRDDGAIVKSKGAYARVATPGGLVPAAEAARIDDRLRAVARAGDDGWLESLSLEEHRTASLGADMPSAKTDARLSLRLVGTRPDPSLLGRFEREADGLSITGPFGTGDEAKAVRASDERAAAGASMEDLLALARGAAGDAETGAIADRMSARLRLTPEDADRMAPLARTLPVGEARVLVSALGAAGTRASVSALGKILGDEGAPAAIRAEAASHLAFADEHALEAREPLTQGLRDASRDVRESSALALGNVARTLDGDGDSVAELVRRYEEARSLEERALYLRALGNTGSAEVLPIARAVLEHDEDALREVAVQALRFLPVGEADAVLSQALVTDPADAVRVATVDAIGYRLVEMHLPALERAVAADAAGAVRAAIREIASRALARRGGTLSAAAREALQALVDKTA